MAKKKAFILDTNILFLYFKSMLSDANFNSSYKLKNEKCLSYYIRLLFETRKIIIPKVCFFEFASNVLQSEIDLDNYNYWYNKRFSIFQKLFRLVNDPCRSGRVTLCDNADEEAKELIQKPLSDVIISELKTMVEERKKKGRLGAREPKFLDGQDSVILCTALSIAKNNEKDLDYYFLTNDGPTALAATYYMNETKNCGEKTLAGVVRPWNLKNLLVS